MDATLIAIGGLPFNPTYRKPLALSRVYQFINLTIITDLRDKLKKKEKIRSVNMLGIRWRKMPQLHRVGQRLCKCVGDPMGKPDAPATGGSAIFGFTNRTIFGKMVSIVKFHCFMHYEKG